MPTTDERREVAARLRNTLLTEGASQYMMEHDCDEHYAVAEVVFRNLRHLLGFDNTYSVHDVAYRLADLIEPEPERACEFSTYMKDGDPYPTCSACGFESDAYDCRWLFDGSMEYSGKFCVNCGARVKEG